MPLPAKPTDDKVRGWDVLILANTGTAEAPVLTPVAGQRGATLNRESDELDTSSKDSDGWADSDYGVNSWGFELDGVLSETDEGYEAMELAWEEKEPVFVVWQKPNRVYGGWANISEIPEEAPHDDVATYSMTLAGRGRYYKAASVTDLLAGTYLP